MFSIKMLYPPDLYFLKAANLKADYSMYTCHNGVLHSIYNMCYILFIVYVNFSNKNKPTGNYTRPALYFIIFDSLVTVLGVGNR